MGLDCGKFSNLILGTGLGIIILSCLVAGIWFIRYDSFLKDDLERKYFHLNWPWKYDGDIYSSAMAISVCGLISAIAGLAAFFILGFSGGMNMIVLIVIAISALVALGCDIAEGLFNYYSLQKNVQESFSPIENWRNPSSYPPLLINFKYPYRNSSKAQKWLKDATKDLYDQAVENLELKYDELKGKVPKWEDAVKLIGEETPCARHPGRCFFNYPDLDVSDQNPNDISSFPKKKVFDTVRFHTMLNKYWPDAIEGVIYAFYLNNSYVVEVASTRFNATEVSPLKEKRRVCWNKTDTEYECKFLQSTEERYFGGVMVSKKYGVIQNMMIDEARFFPISGIKNQTYMAYTYELPLAYRKLSLGDANAERVKKTNPFFFTEDTNHFGLKAKSYAQEAYKKENKECEDEKNKPIYWCTESPSEWKDAFVENPKCESNPIGFPDNTGNELYLPALYNGTNNLQVAFDMANIGIFPDFVIKYLKKQYRENHMSMEFISSSAVAVSTGALICQVFGIVFLIIGIVLSYGSKDYSQA